jgi:DNA-binding PadR family transcriptional regulator
MLSSIYESIAKMPRRESFTTEEDLVRGFVRGFNRAIILWLLESGPKCGYEIVKEIRKLTGRRQHSGVVYPQLYQLEKAGLVRSRWQSKGRRHLNYYFLTAKGKRFTSHMRRTLARPVREAMRRLLGEERLAPTRAVHPP